MTNKKSTRPRQRGPKSGKDAKAGLLSDQELAEVEARYVDGVTAVEIVEIFASRELRFSEATFRKYVQQGLLPRSRRIGRKGKHRGSLGVYPSRAIRRINLIKSFMSEGYTIEEIQGRFLQFTDVIERLDDDLSEAFALFHKDVSEPRFDASSHKELVEDIALAERCADELLRRVNRLSDRLGESHENSYGSSAAAGSAEDLL